MFGRRLSLCVLLALLGSAALGTGSSVADVAPQQWQPTSADVARTVRQCPPAASAPTAPACWSMTEDTSTWMAQPAGSPYGWAQCTYYVGLMRPDIWNDRAPSSVDPVTDWDAWTWAGHAQAEGLAVDGDPRPGDVMVWSRQAVSNDTGHVAIVDAVGPTDPATGELEITISEMNLDGVDDASKGQGDTMMVELPAAQLVPGLVQFIHRPGPGQWATEANPSLGVGVWSDHVAMVSQSPAPVVATVLGISARPR
jgi:surface antigen